MATLFENFVNKELPKRVSTDIPPDGNLPAGKFLKTTGIGLGVEPSDVTGEIGELVIYDIAGGAIGMPTAGAIVTRFAVVRSFYFKHNFADSQGIAEVPATADATFLIQKNDVTIGTMTFAAGSEFASFSSSGEEYFSIRDSLTVIAPDPQDTTLSGLEWTLVGILT
jgi:hypothetical protein